MVAPIQIGSGIEVGSGISVGPNILVPMPPILLLSLDAGNPLSYPGTGTTWTDIVSSISFTLNGGVTYSSSNGGYLIFNPASSQYADSIQSLNNIATWTVEVWHYYTGTNTGFAPCIVTELFPSLTNNINYSIGSNLSGSNSDLQSGFFNGSWRTTPSGYSLTPNNWYQIVGTYDGSTIKLYINNTLVETDSYVGTPISGGSGIRLMRRWDDSDYWGGNLAIVKIYQGAFTAGNVTASWNTNKSRFGL